MNDKRPSWALRALTLALAVSFPALALAEIDVASVPYKPGDLVIKAGEGPEAAALEALTGNPLTEVGLIRETGGGPCVLFAAAEFGSDELPLEAFIARGRGERYALYRPNDRRAIGTHTNPATARIAYDRYHLAPYDPLWLPEAEALYGAEMIEVTFEAVGVPLAPLRPLSARNVEAGEVRAFLMANAAERADCAGLTEAACWQLVRETLVVTPADLADSPRLDRVHGTFSSNTSHQD